jgi:hypothetical protein
MRHGRRDVAQMPVRDAQVAKARDLDVGAVSDRRRLIDRRIIQFGRRLEVVTRPRYFSG